MMLSKIIGKKVDFYSILNDQSAYIVDSIDALKAYVNTRDAKYSEKVKEIEKNADLKRSELVQGLNKTFITPFDREDIYMLSKSLDDVLDYYKSTINEMEIYKINYSSELVIFIQILQEGSIDIKRSVQLMKTDSENSVQNAMKAKKSENKIEKLYRQSIAMLLESEDIKYIIKMRELYRHLSNCADRIDNTADIICNILMKEVI